MGLNEQSLLPMILATALLKPETFPCLAPIINALKNDEGNLLCCNKIYDSNLVIDPTVIQTTKKNDE